LHSRQRVDERPDIGGEEMARPHLPSKH